MRGRIVGATRIVGFGRRCVALGWREERGREVVDFLFRDLPQDEIGAPQARLDLALDPSGRGGRLGIDGRPLWSAPSTLALARRLLHEVLERLSDRCEAGLLAHAAAVERDGLAVALPGRSGAGKTTLCAWLVSRGFGYLTDELVFVPRGSLDVEGFTRPLSLKLGGAEALRPHVRPEIGAAAPDWAGDLLLPHRLIGRRPTPARSRLDLWLFPTFEAGSELRIEPLCPAEAAKSVLEATVNARNLDRGGLPEAGRLCRASEAFSLRYGSFDQLTTALLPFLERRLAAIPA